VKQYQISKQRCERITRAFSRSKIMVVGDAIVDKYLWGNVQRISPEAPVPVVEVQRETTGFGGAANVARNLKWLGATPFLLCLCGADSNGRMLRRMLDEIGCSADGVIASPSRPTTVKTRVMAKHQQIVRTDMEMCSDLSVAERRKLLSQFEKWLPDADAVIISDYGKGVISPPFVELVIEQCKEADVFVAIDPKIQHFKLYSGVDIITPNLNETHAALGLSPAYRSDEEIQDIGWQLVDMLDLRYLLITLSERGMGLFEKCNRQYTQLATVAQAVYDVTGAGDTVIGAFTAAITSNASPIEAAFLANHAAGLTVAELGTSAVTARQLRSACLK
jgi:D-beta-D-heptose 7-phosphate kinase/D-beta-D-heptose 1-phosphate adenosyltransferase